MDNSLHQSETYFQEANRAALSGQADQAHVLYMQAIAVLRQGGMEQRLNIANVYNALAILEQSRGETRYALDFACRAEEQFWQLGSQMEPAAVEVRLVSLGLIGNLQRHLALYSEAESTLRKALDCAVSVFGEAHEETTRARNNLGVLYKYTGQYEQAEKLCRAALANIEAAQGTQNEFAATLYHNLSGLAHARGDFSAGLAEGRKAWDVRRALLGEDAPETLADAAAYAGLLDGLGRYEESEPIYKRVLKAFEEFYGSDHYEIAVILNNLANVRSARGDMKGAERYFRRSLGIKEKILGPQHPDTALTANNLGVLLQRLGRPEEASVYFLRAQAVFEQSLGPDHPKTQMVRDNLAALEALPA